MGSVMRPAFVLLKPGPFAAMRKAVQHAVHHQIRRTVAQIRNAQGNVAPEHSNVEKWLFVRSE